MTKTSEGLTLADQTFVLFEYEYALPLIPHDIAAPSMKSAPYCVRTQSNPSSKAASPPPSSPERVRRRR